MTAGSDMISLGRGPGSVAMPAASKTQLLIRYLLGEIESGRLQPGDRIPTAAKLREIGGQLADQDEPVSITVVREAVNWLKARGLVEGMPGVAVFVAERRNPDE